MSARPVRKPRCLVAMALGDEETKALFGKGIRPVLAKTGISQGHGTGEDIPGATWTRCAESRGARRSRPRSATLACRMRS